MRLELEAEMVRSGARVVTVDERGRGGPVYYSCSLGVESQRCEKMTAAEAYGLLYADLWSSRRAVGVDLEGTSTLQVAAGGLALMVQVSSAKVVVVEYPRGRCSEELRKLLADEDVAKVFCGLEGDVGHFGPGVTLKGNLIDLQSLTKDNKKNRSLTDILDFGAPNGETWTKRSIKKYRWWRFTNADHMINCPHLFPRYAAADAWGTLFAYEQLDATLDNKARDKETLPRKKRDTSRRTKTQDVAHLAPLCRFFGTRAGCKNGANCRFQHIIPPVDTAPLVVVAPHLAQSPSLLHHNT